MSDFDDAVKPETEGPWEHKTTADYGKGGTFEGQGGGSYTHTTKRGSKLKGSLEGTVGKPGKEQEKDKKTIADLEAGVELERGAIKHKGAIKGVAAGQGATGETAYQRTRTEDRGDCAKREHAHRG